MDAESRLAPVDGADRLQTMAGQVAGKWLAAAIAGLTAVIGLHVWSLLRFPPPFVDEAWFAARAWAVVSGNAFSSLDRGVIDQFYRSWFFFPLVPNVLYAAALAVAGTPALVAVRLVSLAAGGVLALAVWKIARQTGGPVAAWLATGLTILSATFMFSAHLARYDILAAAGAYGAIALYFCSSGQGWRSLGAAGVCAGLSLEMHPFAAVGVSGLLAALAFDVFGRRIRLRDAAAFAAGGGVASAVWACVHVLPSISTYLALNALLFAPTHAPGAGRSPSEIISAGTETALLLSWTYGAATPLIAAALAWVLSGNRWQVRRAGVVAIASLFAFAVLVRNRNIMYFIHVTPAVDICLGLSLAHWMPRLNYRRELTLVAVALCAVMLAYTVAGNIRPLAHDFSGDYTKTADRIARSVRSGDSIMGSQTYWFTLHDHQYYSWEQLVYLRRYKPHWGVVDALTALKPDVVVRDAHWDRYIRDEPGESLYERLLMVPRTEFEDWLAGHAELADDFDGAHYGRIRVYRLDWSHVSSSRGSP